MKKSIFLLIYILIVGASNNLSAQKLINFKISPCKQDCHIQADIISETIENG